MNLNKLSPIKLIIIFWLLIYLAFAFVMADTNPFNWSMSIRGLMISTYPLAIIIVIALESQKNQIMFTKYKICDHFLLMNNDNSLYEKYLREKSITNDHIILDNKNFNIWLEHKIFTNKL